MSDQSHAPGPSAAPSGDGVARPAEVRRVFNSVASRYDLMNDLLSFGLHRSWKRRAIAVAAPGPGRDILDLASGTGDLAIAMARTPGTRVWAADINVTMLAIERERVARQGVPVRIVQCDGQELPFPDDSFDAVTVSFGLRNMDDKDRALRETRRVLRPGGLAVVLEFSRCARWLRPFYDLYSFQIMPRLGSLVVGDAASYLYLARSIRRHPDQATFAAMMTAAGLTEVSWTDLACGICALHVGVKPRA